jgi:hypothetical protein
MMAYSSTMGGCPFTVISQFVTTLVKAHDEPPEPHHGLEHQTG